MKAKVLNNGNMKIDFKPKDYAQIMDWASKAFFNGVDISLSKDKTSLVIKPKND